VIGGKEGWERRVAGRGGKKRENKKNGEGEKERFRCRLYARKGKKKKKTSEKERGEKKFQTLGPYGPGRGGGKRGAPLKGGDLYKNFLPTAFPASGTKGERKRGKQTMKEKLQHRHLTLPYSKKLTANHLEIKRKRGHTIPMVFFLFLPYDGLSTKPEREAGGNATYASIIERRKKRKNEEKTVPQLINLASVAGEREKKTGAPAPALAHEKTAHLPRPWKKRKPCPTVHNTNPSPPFFPLHYNRKEGESHIVAAYLPSHHSSSLNGGHHRLPSHRPRRRKRRKEKKKKAPLPP